MVSFLEGLEDFFSSLSAYFPNSPDTGFKFAELLLKIDSGPFIFGGSFEIFPNTPPADFFIVGIVLSFYWTVSSIFTNVLCSFSAFLSSLLVLCKVPDLYVSFLPLSKSSSILDTL